MVVVVGMKDLLMLIREIIDRPGLRETEQGEAWKDRVHLGIVLRSMVLYTMGWGLRVAVAIVATDD